MAYSIPDKAFPVKRTDDLPEGAIIMTRDEILAYHLKRMEDWEPRYEMWPFSFGIGILGGATAVTASLLNTHFRKKFFLQNVGRFATFGPSVVIPVCVSLLTHSMYVSESILAAETECSVCVETRSASLQMVFGVLYPTIISPLSAIVIARRYKTCSIPLITDGKNVFAMLSKISPRVSLFVLLMANFGVGMFVAGQELTAFNKILQSDKKEKDFSSDGFS